MQVALLPGERWWGGAVVDGWQMPFPDGFARDLQNGGGNQSMPLLLSSKGRYVWADEPFAFRFENDTLHLDGSDIGLHTAGTSLRDAFLAAQDAHFPPDGRFPDSLLFTAPQYNLWIELLQQPTQERVLAYAEAALLHGFPPGVLTIDVNWHERYGEWTFHSGRFPDPKGMVARLGEMGFLIMLWLCPCVTADSTTFRDLRDKGLLCRDDRGKPIIGAWWDGYSAGLDLLNPDAVAWLYDALERLIAETGIVGFKFDGGDVNFWRGLGMAQPHAYTRAWNEIGRRYAFSEYKDCWRSGGWGMAQRIRDRYHNWDAHHGVRSLIPMGIAQGLTGFRYNCPDMIGGGEFLDFLQGGEASVRFDPELFVRYAQIAALFPMMQFSAAPWRLLDEEYLAYCRDAAHLHVRFGAEIWRLAQESARSGEPLLRSLEYVYPGEGYTEVMDQFLLGERWLVAPVVEKGARARKVVFPPGEWEDEDGRRYSGPAKATVHAPLSRLPLFQKRD